MWNTEERGKHTGVYNVYMYNIKHENKFKMQFKMCIIRLSFEYIMASLNFMFKACDLRLIFLNCRYRICQ